MIIGTGKRKRVTELLTGVACPFCKAKDTMTAEGFQEFFVFGLPMFASGKTVELRCSQCKKFLKGSSAPYPLDSMAMEVKQKIKPAVWMYAFPLAIAILLPIALIKERVTASNNIAKINTVHKGDVYTIKVGKSLYQKMQVSKTNGDSVWFSPSLNGPHKLSKLGINDIYAGNERIYTKQQLLTINGEYDIHNIDQDNTPR